MKRLLNVLLISLLAISLLGCNKKQEEENANMKNPVVEYDSLQKINEIAGTNIVEPGVMGKTDQRYSVISDELAQYNFSLNGKAWTIRGAKNTKDDISGIHNENNIFEENQDAIIYLTDYYIYRFFTDDTQYSIVLDKPEGFDEETFCTICNEIEFDIKGIYPPTEDELVGEYADSYSQRATATITKEDDGLYIVVSWSSSANVTDSWTMFGTLDGYRISYAGEGLHHVEYDEDGNELVADGATNNVGYFDYEDGKLYWTGAGDENNRNCVFEKIS